MSPVEIAERQLNVSRAMTTPLKKMIIEQYKKFTKLQLQSVKSSLHQKKIVSTMLPRLNKWREKSKGNGLGNIDKATMWLTALPLQEHMYRFTFNKQKFQNELCLWYGW